MNEASKYIFNLQFVCLQTNIDILIHVMNCARSNKTKKDYIFQSASLYAQDFNLHIRHLMEIIHLTSNLIGKLKYLCFLLNFIARVKYQIIRIGDLKFFHKNLIKKTSNTI